MPGGSADALLAAVERALMLDETGAMLVDGRNRLRACQIAGITPRFDRLAAGVEPRDFIAGANLRRRNLTKGQQAMMLATLYPEPEKGGHGQKTIVQHEGFSADRLYRARAVLRVAPDDLTPLVLSGVKVRRFYALWWTALRNRGRGAHIAPKEIDEDDRPENGNAEGIRDQGAVGRRGRRVVVLQ